MRGRDSLSLEMKGLSKDHGEKNKRSESVAAMFAIKGHRKGWCREMFLTSLSPETRDGIKRFILCWN